MNQFNSSSSKKSAEPVKFSPHLSGDVILRIHTKKAQSLFRSSWNTRNMGLFQFAAVMTHIYQASDQDDPYADWIILKITKTLEVLNQEIENSITEFEQALKKYRGFEVEIFGSRFPFKVLADFATPLSYMTSYTIANLDYLLRQAFTFRRVGILPESQETAQKLFWSVKAMMSQCRKWQYTGVTRQDIREHNAKALSAKEKMGKLPKKMLDQENKSRKKFKSMPERS